MTRDELQQRINERMSLPAIAEGVRLVEHARGMASLLHKGQYYGSEPYTVHLDDVEDILIEYNHIQSFYRAAAQLHDLFEDVLKTEAQRTKFKRDFLMMFPGNEFLFVVVEAVTSEPGKNRKERNTKTYPKISAYLEAVVLKLADRLSNGRKSKASDPGKYAMYKKEYPEFRKALFTEAPETLLMWWELDRIFEYEHII